MSTWHLLTTDFPPQDGGVATWSAGVAGALHEAGETVRVHARARSGARPGDWPFAVHPVPGRWWRRGQAAWMAGSLLPRLRRGDRVLAATWPLAVGVVDAAGALGVPVGVAFHGSDLTRPPPIAGLARIQRGATALLPVSRFLGGLLDGPWTRLPMPVDPLPPVPRGDALLVVARLVPGKGVDRALRLGARLGRRVLVVGDGPDRARLEALGGEARFLGRLPHDAVPWEQAWAVALLSEAPEGLGLVLLEAAARGIPGIGSASGGIPEAADVVLHDPEVDPVPELPDPLTVQARLRAGHGRAALVATLRRVLA